MKKLLSFYLLVSMGLSQNAEGQTGSQVASASFGGSGLSEMEMQVLYTRFFEQLTAASDNPLMDSENVDSQIDNDCITTECLKAGIDALGVQQLIAGTLKFSNNKYRVKARRMDASKSKPKKYSIRYKGEPDGFITELEILAWKMMDKEPPESLTGKRKPNQESFFEKIAENPWAKRGLVLTVAGLGGASYVSNMSAASKSKDAADAQDKSWSGYQSAYDAHMASHDKSKNEATLSLVAALAAVGYGYYIGVFSEEE
tara:strand:- start:228 stop:998 length:771 start_codon:yes stop_codon:yes gene_type:complete